MLLSCNNTFCLTSYICDSRKSLVHNIRLDASSAPTNSYSVLLFVFSFCFCYTDKINPLPIVNVAPVCNLKFECTANTRSTYHFRQLVLYEFNVRHNS